MIIVKVQGGLGNQLFQYSFGKLLEKMYTKEVAYDVSFFTKDTPYTKRPYLLDSFATSVRIANSEELKKVKYPYGHISKILYFLRKAFNRYVDKKYHIVYEENLVRNISQNRSAYIEGTFQSYRYVTPVLESIQKEILSKNIVSNEHHTIVHSMEVSESVMVHIRRGDFLHGGTNLQVLGKEYYVSAVQYIESTISNPKYFIFSDDISWVKENMGELFNEGVYVSDDRFSESEELVMMTHARHAIIANSTFSWWGAMLSRYVGKRTVICPKDWKNVFLHNNQDICPKEWISI